jgi:hypothetical protein
MLRVGWRGRAIIGFAAPVLMAVVNPFRLGDSGLMALSILALPVFPQGAQPGPKSRRLCAFGLGR